LPFGHRNPKDVNAAFSNNGDGKLVAGYLLSCVRRRLKRNVSNI